MNNLKGLELYATESAFKTQELDLSNPTVAYIEEGNKTYIRPRCSIRLVYDIQDSVNQRTSIFNYIDGSAYRVISMSIDGVILDQPVTTYTFNTTGQHIVRAIFEYKSGLFQILDNADSNNELVEVKFEDKYSINGEYLILHDMGIYNSNALNKVTKLDLMELPLNYSNQTTKPYLDLGTRILPNLETLIMPKNIKPSNVGVNFIPVSFNGTVYLPKSGDYMSYITEYTFPNATILYYDKNGNLNA